MGSQNERLVATLDGDSSGLVDAMRKASDGAKDFGGAAGALAKASAGIESSVDAAGASAEALAKDSTDAAKSVRGLTEAELGAAKAGTAESAASRAAATAAAEQASAAEAAAAAERAKASASEQAAATSSRMQEAQAIYTRNTEANTTALNENIGTLGKLKSAFNTASGQMGPIGAGFNAITNLLGPLGVGIAGVSAGLIGLNASVQRYTESARQQLMATEEGRQAWEAARVPLSSFSDALRDATSTQEDAVQTAARAAAVNEAMRGTWDALLAPVKAFSDLARGVIDAMLGVDERADSLKGKLGEVGKSAQSAADHMRDLQNSIEDALAGEYDRQRITADRQAKEFEGEQDALRLKAMNAEANKKYAEEVLAIDKKHWGLGEEADARRQAAVDRAYRESREHAARMWQDEQLRERMLGDELGLYQDLGDAAARVREEAEESIRRAKAARTRHTEGRHTEEEIAPAEPEFDPHEQSQRLAREMEAAAAQQAEEADASRHAAMVSRKQVEADLMIKNAELDKQVTDEAIANKKAREEAENKESEAFATAKGAAKDFLEGSVKSIAAATIASKKASQDLATTVRSAIGTQIQAIGDMAVVKALEAGAKYDWVTAGLWAGVATTAYATASIMKPNTSAAASASAAGAGAAPATQATQQAVTYNYALNINDAFADTEDVTRRFAALDRRATSSGLVPARGGAG